MNGIIDSKLFNILLLITIIGEFLLPWILKHFYKGYNSKTMVMSVLGSPESPVRKIYNIWLVWLGVFLLGASFLFYKDVSAVSSVLAVMFLSFFIMCDKEKFKGTILTYEGLWERLSLLFMYMPFLYCATGNIIA